MVLSYSCPYDTTPGPFGIVRVCAMIRHIPVIPNAAGFTWHEAEILGNHTLVEVEADAKMHAVIQADPGITLMPDTLEGADRDKVRTHLEGLGYTRAELEQTGWDMQTLRETLTAVASPITKSADGQSIIVQPGRRTGPKRQRRRA